MKIFFIFSAVLSLWLAAAHAQPVPAAQASDPAAPVPGTTYRSVFSGMPAGVEADRDDWKKANAEVGRFSRGHIDILKWEQQQGAAVPGREAAAPASGATKSVAPRAHQH